MPLKSPLSTSGAGRVQRQWRAKAASATQLLTDKLQHEHKVQRRHNVVNALNVATRWMAKCPNVPAQVHNHCHNRPQIYMYTHTQQRTAHAPSFAAQSRCAPAPCRGKSEASLPAHRAVSCHPSLSCTRGSCRSAAPSVSCTRRVCGRQHPPAARRWWGGSPVMGEGEPV